MPILPSAGKRIQELLRQLGSTVATERESAVARLTLVGPRTVPHLLGFLQQAEASGKLAALDVLERLGEPGGLAAVLPSTRDRHEGVALRAIEVAAGFPDPRAAFGLADVLSEPSSARRRAAVLGLGQLVRGGVVEAVEPLLGVLLDQEEEEAARLLALESLSSLDQRALSPALQTLAKDKAPAIARAAAGLGRRLLGQKESRAPTPEPEIPALLARLTSARTSSAEVSAVMEALVKRRAPALLPLLVERLELLSTQAPTLGAEAIARAKARLHLALGALGSRLALHDLREMLKARPPYAARDLLAAAALVGDASLVPPLATLAAEEPSLAAALTPAFQAIVRRENLRRTSAALRGLGEAQRAALEAAWPLQRGASGGASRARNRKLR